MRSQCAGKTRVALCLAPARLIVDGKTTELSDGGSLSVDDVELSRRGDVYLITGPGGRSVSAEVNPTWINVSVGLGRWPFKVRGLLGNAEGKVNEIQTRDGAVLTNPFSFQDLYQRYAESWRVPARESLLSVCGEEIERSIPQAPFYANDLDPKLRERTRAVCTATGVKGPLVDACTLDVAVIGNDAAAKVFVDAHAPLAVGSTTPEARRPKFMVWLLLLLILLAVILWIVLRMMRKTP